MTEQTTAPADDINDLTDETPSPLDELKLLKDRAKTLGIPLGGDVGVGMSPDHAARGLLTSLDHPCAREPWFRKCGPFGINS